VFRFFLIFLVVLAVLFGVEQLVVVQNAVVLPWTALVAKASAVIARFFDPTIISHGKILQSAHTGFSVSIESGCNGVEASVVLIGAMLAFPSTWKMKFWGILLGFVAVQAVNLLRVVTLFFVGEWSLKVFEFAHLYMWQALIMLDVLVVWLLWMRIVAKRGPRPAPASSPTPAPA